MADLHHAHPPDARRREDDQGQPVAGPRGQQGGRAARGQGAQPVGDAGRVRLRHRGRGARREGDGEALDRDGLARHGDERDPDRDRRGGLHRSRYEDPRRRRRRSRARDRPRARALARRRRSSSARPATPGSPPTPAAWRRPGDVEPVVEAAAARGLSTWSSSGPRRRWSTASSTRSRPTGSPPSGPTRRGGAARGLEGAREGADGRGRRADRRPHACCAAATRRSSSSPRIDYPAVLKADGLAAGKGVIICATEAEARAAVETFFVERRFGADRGRARGVPRGRGALAARPLRRRERRPAGAGPGLQADLRRRPRARTPAAWAATRRSPGSTPATRRRDRRRGPPPDRRADARARDAVPRRPLRRPDADRRRAEGARVQLPLRRPRDPGRAAAAARATCSSSSCALAEPGGLAGVEPAFSDDWAVTVVLASAGYPESSSKGDVISGLDPVAAGVEVTHAGTARDRRRRGRHRRRAGAEPDRARRRARPRPASAPTRRARMIDFDGKQMRTDIAERAVAAVAS